MAKGLPKWAIKEAKARGAKNIFAYAWTLVKRKGKKGSRKSNPKTKRRGGKKMARRKRSYRRSMTIPLAPIAGLAAGLATPLHKGIVEGNWFGETNSFISWLKYNYLGITPEGNFSMDGLKNGLLPLIAGLLVHKFVGGSPLNLNRMLARHKIPLIRI